MMQILREKGCFTLPCHEVVMVGEGVMERLSEQFDRNKWTFTQVIREGLVAVYRRTKGRVTDWEVVKIRESKESSRQKDGEVIRYQAKEVYPSSEEWGVRGWTYTEEEAALEKFEQLKNQKKKTV